MGSCVLLHGTNSGGSPIDLSQSCLSSSRFVSMFVSQVFESLTCPTDFSWTVVTPCLTSASMSSTGLKLTQLPRPVLCVPPSAFGRPLRRLKLVLTTRVLPPPSFVIVSISFWFCLRTVFSSGTGARILELKRPSGQNQHRTAPSAMRGRSQELLLQRLLASPAWRPSTFLRVMFTSGCSCPPASSTSLELGTASKNRA